MRQQNEANPINSTPWHGAIELIAISSFQQHLALAKCQTQANEIKPF
jgi:hypothetical protein